MRLFLLPVSTRRTLLYAQRLNVEASKQSQGWGDRIQAKAAQTWAGWEQKESGWQKTIVNYGNYALRRIPYEEWGLKSVPPLSTKRKDDELKGSDKVEVIYPKTLISASKVTDVLDTLSTERAGLHRKRLIWCLIGMPISAPFALVPVYVHIINALKSLMLTLNLLRQDSESSLFLSCLSRMVALASLSRREAHPVPTQKPAACP